MLRLRLDPPLDDRAVRDEEAEHEDRQCRNWPDHDSGIARIVPAHDPWNEVGGHTVEVRPSGDDSLSRIHLSGSCAARPALRP